MRFDWRQYLALSKAIIKGTGAEEARARCAISRAYYAAFHVARSRFCPNYTPLASDSHFALLTEVRRFNEECYQLLDDLRDLRKRADYDDAAFPSALTNAQRSILSAERVIELCR